MAKFPPPNVPYVEAYHQGEKQRPTAIVLRSSFTTSDKGSALGIAQAWHSSNSPLDSCHYVVDSVDSYQCVPDNKVAYSGNSGVKNTISINVCSEPFPVVAFWDDIKHAPVLSRTADLVSELSLAYSIPVRYLDDEQELHWARRSRRSRGGLIIRVVGAWPDNAFMLDVRSKVAVRKAKRR